MARYTRDCTDRVRDAVDFVELVSARTDLRRAGPSRHEGLCPFHEERTPSFGLDPQKKVYHCFGCQASGDLFTFVQETEGLDFVGALELLAERYGVELEREAEDPGAARARRRRERLLELLSRTASYYERCLWESPEAVLAREYLLGRGLSEESLRAFRIGYAPDARDRVTTASRRAGYGEEELMAAGLSQRRRGSRPPGPPGPLGGSMYDRFRGRIVFPLADLRGRVLGFGARSLGSERGPKYLNSSENEIYHKGLHLYGGHIARPHAARAGEVILCEGYTDVIAMHQAGFENTVGLMGTALTAEQIGELARMSSVVILALDADSAGRQAMLRAESLAIRRRLSLRVVSLPEGSDPADLLGHEEGQQAMAAAVAGAVPFVRFRVQGILERGDRESPEGRDRILAELRPVFASLAPSAMRMDLTRLVSGRLDLPERIAESLLAYRPTGGAPSTLVAQASQTPSGRGRETERTFLALCIASPARAQAVLDALEPAEDFTAPLLRRAAEHLRDGHLAEPLQGLSEDDEDLRALMAELVVQAGGEPAEGELLEVQRAQLELSRLERKIRATRASGAPGLAELAGRKRELKLSFDRLQELALQRSDAF